MKQIAYIRVSTGKQTYDRQLHTLREYFTNRGINFDTLEVVAEKITSKTEFKQRAIYSVLKKAQQGDIVYACQLDRFGRTMMDILELVNYATNKGVLLITTDTGFTYENRTPMGKLVLGVLSAMAETERELRAERCQAGIDAAREEIAKNGYRISRSGNIQTKFGQEKGFDMSHATEAASISAQNARIAHRANSPAVGWVVEKIKSGWSRAMVIEEFNKLHEIQPNVFCTRNGCKLSKGVLSVWLRDMRDVVAI